MADSILDLSGIGWLYMGSQEGIRGVLCITFLESCGRDLWTVACLESVVGVVKGMLPVKYLLFTKLFLCPLNFVVIVRLSQT